MWQPMLLVVFGLGASLLANAADSATTHSTSISFQHSSVGDLSWFFDVLAQMFSMPCTQEIYQDPLGYDWAVCFFDDAPRTNLQSRAPLVVPAYDRPVPDEQRRVMNELTTYFKHHPSLDPWASQGGYAHVMAPFMHYTRVDQPCWDSTFTIPLETLAFATFPGGPGAHATNYHFVLPVHPTPGQDVTSTAHYSPWTKSVLATATAVLHVKETSPPRWAMTMKNGIGQTGKISASVKVDKHSQLCFQTFYDVHGKSTTIAQTWQPAIETPTRSKRDVDDTEVRSLSSQLSIGQITTGIAMIGHIPVQDIMTITSSKPIRMSGHFYNDVEGLTGSVFKTFKSHKHRLTEQIITRAWLGTTTVFTVHHPKPTVAKRSQGDVFDVERLTSGQKISNVGVDILAYPVTTSMTVVGTKPVRATGRIYNDVGYIENVFMTWKKHHHTVTVIKTLIVSGHTYSTELPLTTPTPTEFKLSDIQHYTKGQSFHQSGVVIGGRMQDVSMTITALKPVRASGTFTDYGDVATTFYVSFKSHHKDAPTAIVHTQVYPHDLGLWTTSTTLRLPKTGHRKREEVSMELPTPSVLTNPGYTTITLTGPATTVTAIATQTVNMTVGHAHGGTTQIVISNVPISTYTGTIGVASVVTLTPTLATCRNATLAHHVQSNVTDLRIIRAWYPNLDWSAVRILAEQASRINSTHTTEEYMVAAAYCMLSHPGAGHVTPPLPTTSPTVRNASDIVKPTCDPHDKHINQAKCKVEHCLWKHKRPMAFYTVFKAWMVESDNYTVDDYFSHTTSFSDQPHWGSTADTGTYWPLELTTTVDDAAGTPTTIAVRKTPSAISQKNGVHGAPECYDKRTCHTLCYRDATNHHQGFASKYKTLLILVGVGAGTLLAALALCCCWPFWRRRRPTEKNQPPRTTTAIRPVDPATGAAQTVTREVVSPAAVAAGTTGAAIGSTVANEKPENSAGAGDGKGTLGRQAEEGRGKVQFSKDASKDVGADSPTEKVGEAPSADVAGENAAEHVEAVPTQHDGADDTTGSQRYDMSSMRGRRRVRAEQDLL